MAVSVTVNFAVSTWPTEVNINMAVIQVADAIANAKLAVEEIISILHS